MVLTYFPNYPILCVSNPFSLYNMRTTAPLQIFGSTVGIFIFVITTSSLFDTSSSSLSPITLDIDFNSFLSRSDPVWTWTNASSSQPTQWVQSLFGGNGDLGFMIWTPPGLSSTIRIDISRTVVYDDRTPDMPQYMNNFVFDQPRLPIGHFYASWVGNLVNATGKISLYNGIVILNIITDQGTLALNMYASADWTTADVMVLETNSTNNEHWSITWIPEIAQSTWSGQSNRYVPNPAPFNSSSSIGNNLLLNMTTQAHLKGTAHTTAILQSTITTQSTIYYITISPVLSSTTVANNWATAQVQQGQQAGYSLRIAHVNWWNSFWPNGGFITVEYSILESFWFIQIYKFASGTQEGRALHDLEGPWFIDGTDWPDLHWDMNLQQTYYLPIAANRPSLASTLVDFMTQMYTSGNFNTNVPPEWQADSAAAPTGASSLSGNMSCYWVYGPNCTTSPPSVTGNLLWALQLVHLTGLYAANDTIQTDIVFPMLTRALQAYQHFQIPNEFGDGVIHLPVTFSPEYPGPQGPDANYDLSLYRWGLNLAIALAGQYNIQSPYLTNWQNTLANLSWYSIDNSSNTFEIYRGIPYGTPHRHYSHLFMIWPLRALEFTNSSQYLTAKLSIDRWLATPELDSEFYRPAASAMNTMLRQRAAAFDNITFLLHTRIEANTFYREGSQGSCTETPYAAAWAVCDWFVQSWNHTFVTGKATRVIEFYPGIDDIIIQNDTAYVAAPAKVATGTFYRLGTEGGYLVSGARSLVVSNTTHYITRTNFIGIEAPMNPTAILPSILVRTNMDRPLLTNPSSITLTEMGENVIQITGLSTPGQGVAIYSGSYPVPSFSISESDGCPTEFNYWGYPLGSSSNPNPTSTSQYVDLETCIRNTNGSLTSSQTYSFSNGLFILQDGSNRCLMGASCAASPGTRLVLAPCITPSNSSNNSIGCDSSSSCTDQLQQWTWTGPNGVPPNALKSPLGGGLCMDVNGAVTPNIIDLWTCDNPPGEYKNLEWMYNATDGGIYTLDTYPGVAGKCLTPVSN